MAKKSDARSLNGNGQRPTTRQRRAYNPNIIGIGEVLTDAAALLQCYDSMDLPKLEDVDSRRKQVKERVVEIQNDESKAEDGEFCQHTIGITVVMMNHIEATMDGALTTAWDEFDSIVQEIKQRSPARARSIADKLEEAQTSFRDLKKDATLKDRAAAFGRVNTLLLDTLEEIEEEEERTKRHEVRQGLGKLLVAF